MNFKLEIQIAKKGAWNKVNMGQKHDYAKTLEIFQAMFQFFHLPNYLTRCFKFCAYIKNPLIQYIGVLDT
jgi:hypothetical protein